MTYSPERLSPPMRLSAVLGALLVAMMIAGLDRMYPASDFAPLEIIPLAIVAWLFPLAVSLPCALAGAFWLAYLQVHGSYRAVFGATVTGTSLSLAVVYVSIVLLVSQISRSSDRRVATTVAQLHAVGEVVPFGAWSATPDGQLTYVSDSMLELLGRTWEQERGFGWMEHGRTSSGAEKLEGWKRIVAENKPFEFERDVIGADGKRYWLLTRGVPVRDASGNVVLYTGINLDITERRQIEDVVRESEERHRFLAESIPQIVWICSADGNIEYFNGRWYAYSGIERGAPIVGEFPRRIHPADRDRSFKTWLAAGRGPAETYEAEVRLRASDGKYRWFLSRAVAQTDRAGRITHWFGTSTDIDARKRAQEQLAFLARASEAIASSLDVADTCNVLAQLAVPAIADWCGVYLLDADGTIDPIAIAHEDPVLLERAWEMERVNHRTVDSPGTIAAAIRTGDVQIAGLDDPVQRRAVAIDRRHEVMMESLGFGATICVPMISGGQPIGAILLINRESVRVFEPADYDLARELARRAASAVDNARAFDRERHVADALQTAFLPPTLPEIPGLAFDAVYMPGAEESAIGGDWYDAFQLYDGRVVVSIGDVAGRGLRAAVVMGRVRESIRAFALQDLSPGRILAATERVLHLGTQPAMVTALVAIFDPLMNTLTLANAGHPPPLLGTPDGTVRTLQASGVPLGIFDDPAPHESTIELPDDALLVFYTDGLIEVDRDVVRGSEALEAAVRAAMRSGERSASAIFRTIIGERRAEDDVAVLTLAVSKLARGPIELDLPAVPESARLVRAALERFAAAHQLLPDQRFALEVAVGEAVTNAIEHAYGIGAGRFAVRASETLDGLDVEIQDTGAWRPARNEGRGRGVPMMHALARSVDIASDSDGTRIRLSFASGPAASDRA